MKFKLIIQTFTALLFCVLFLTANAQSDWKPGEVTAICAGEDGSFYLKYAGNPSLIHADKNGKILKSWGFGKGNIPLNPADTAVFKNLNEMVSGRNGQLFFTSTPPGTVYKFEKNRIQLVSKIQEEKAATGFLPATISGFNISQKNELLVSEIQNGKIRNWKINPTVKTTTLLNDVNATELTLDGVKLSRDSEMIIAKDGTIYFLNLTREGQYFPGITKVTPEGKLILLANNKAKTRYADGNMKENGVVVPYNLELDKEQTLYFSEPVSWAAGKTFYHFGAIRRLSPSGNLQTIAGCGTTGSETNTIVPFYYIESENWKYVPTTINGKPMKIDKMPEAEHRSLDYTEEVTLEMERLAESNAGLFFRTGELGRILFTVLSTGELLVVTGNTPLIHNEITLQKSGKTVPENLIELTKVTMENCVKCQPISIKR